MQTDKPEASQPSQTGSSLSPQSSALSPAFLLTLDVDGVYWGATQIHPEDAREGDVILDHIPDNAPGKYRWDRAEGRLQPLPRSQQKELPTAPDLERAFDELCQWLSDGGSIALPAAVAQWREGYRKSIDKSKSAD